MPDHPDRAPAPIVHVDVRGLDKPGLATFYRDIFGWERQEDLSVENYSVSRIGTVDLTAAVGPVPDWSSRSTTFYIQVDDIDATLNQIEAAGGRRVMPRTVGPEFGASHILIFTKFVDPAGNVVGLVERPKS